jgi:hypothetical protein
MTESWRSRRPLDLPWCLCTKCPTVGGGYDGKRFPSLHSKASQAIPSNVHTFEYSSAIFCFSLSLIV